MAATLKDLYDAFNAGASRATLLRLIEELERIISMTIGMRSAGR